MNPVLIGQLLGVSFACGLNLYATVAALGIFSRIGLFQELPPALRGLESSVVIGTAVILFLVEAIVDRVHHADSIWDTVHTFIRPPAAALLAIGAFWGQPTSIQVGAAAVAFVIALAAHGAKAGFRVALNATKRNGSSARISTLEDVAAVAFVFAALEYPSTAMATGALVLVILAVFGPRLWRAFALGLRCLAAWFRTLFTTPGWREPARMPRRLRELLQEPPLGMGPARATRAAVNGLPGAGAYRNGWLVTTHQGPAFLFGGWLTGRRINLPEARSVQPDPGLWLHTARVETEGQPFTLYLLKDGPPFETVLQELEPVTTSRSM
jgi:hypothetical protein